MPTGGTYERTSFIHPRIAGSSDRYSSSTRNCPSSGSGAGSSKYSQSEALGQPHGRAADPPLRVELWHGLRLLDGLGSRPERARVSATSRIAADREQAGD